MRIIVTWPLFLLIGIAFLSEIQARRIRLQPRPLPQEETEETIQYYAAEPQEDVDNRQRVVLVSSADQYNGLYGQPTSAPRGAAQDNYRDNYIPRESPKGRQYIAQRVKETPKEPPVQTIRNYNKVNDDGSFTFGYEAADGSFKEETRGTDCVVRGKYGYVDPDGNKREFTYVSGNPCDPNAPKDEDDQASENESPENENIPANYPTRPIGPLSRPVSTPKPAVTLFQTQYEQAGEEEQPEPEQLLRPTPTPIQSIRSRPQYIARPQYVQQPQQQQIAYQRPQHQLVPSSTPVSTLYRQQVQPVTITPRPLLQTASPTTATRTQLPATTFRPQIVPVSATPRPQLLYSPKTVSPAPTKGIDFDAEFQRFQQENNVVSPTPSSASKGVGTRPEAVGQLYSSALVYDPTTGQYKNQLYQSIPQTESDFSFNQRIQPYVHQQQQQQQQQQRPTVSLQQQRPTVSLQQYQQQYQQQSPLYRQQVQQINPQAVYQAQQAGLQFQNSAQLYAQQQKARQQQQQQLQQQQSIAQKPATAQQPVYYIQPSVDGTGALGASQIDAFLRGHNIQY
ncbi:unnamed protein product [Ceutorhynchus assimilis]|uniref:Uncharacterized protein n=1 Tax=Ceutorhynchus assimilis TaxID=467358 RepID=A0A9P0DF26_9CUCU|nr:unnamed protein product [Ceutorhynchus assimilis]